MVPQKNSDQPGRLREGLKLAGVWPGEGQVSPPYGLTPEQMRGQMWSAIKYLDGELLLAAFYVLLLLVSLKKTEARPILSAEFRR